MSIILWIIFLVVGVIIVFCLFLIYIMKRTEGERDWLMRIPHEPTFEEEVNKDRRKKLKKIL